ncbi:efflux transporter outer membrane subunit [Roseomonas terrae]|jgi:NodT family efflux transporter outer membrane factor (OMF) lipoprotein|uniref:Efflux transporter outer membrane subunit n=1 Tax=Neoroseomonas terrae TaxID=424799 RepID=A0ABS5EFW5_9PROT|nr:efflux transporter outer membrane subunit [Neoroseomonas terrae]MBR0649900.1 efflux transporter outer membrane subunit [Neoroseomonas terrae]
MTRSAHPRFRATVLAVLLPLAACKVGPDFTEPSASLAERWLQASDRSVITDRTTYERWWTVFNDPTLNDLVDMAYRQNLTLLTAGTRVLEARAALGVAAGEFYPQSQTVGGGLSYIRPSESDPSGIPQANLGEFWRGTLAASAVWELDFWGRFRRGVQSADAAYLASIATYDDVLVTLVGDVASTYVGIRTLQVQIAIARANVARQRVALQIARDRWQGGVSTALDVAQAENVLAQTEASIPQLTAQLQQGEAALRVLLGLPPQRMETLLAGRPDIPVLPEAVAVGIPAELLRRRPDIRAAELRAAAQSEQIGMALAELYPAFSLSGVFGTQASNIGRNRVSDMFNASAIQFAFGANFSWPILNYGQITNTVRVQDARLQGLLTEYRNTVLSAQRDVENGLSGYIQGGQQVVLLQRSVRAAEQALSIAMDQYRMGTRDFTTVLTAMQNLYAAQNSLAVARGARARALTSLYRALGGGWELRQGNDFVNDATRDQMRARTDWGRALPPAGTPQPAAPGLPGPADRGPDIRAPQW